MDAEKIWAAIDRFEDGNKWVKGTVWDDGQRCLIGALGAANDYTLDVYNRVEAMPEADVVAGIICSQFPDRVYESPGALKTSIMYQFNDDDKTTYDDVRMVLEKAAIQQDEAIG